MTDGFFSRPGLAAVGLRPARPVGRRASTAASSGSGCTGWKPCCPCTPISTTRWTRLSSPSAPAHGSSAASRRPRSASAAACPQDRVVVATPGEADHPRRLRRHADRGRNTVRRTAFPGVIAAPVVPPVKTSAYKCGEAWSTLVHHRPSNRRLLVVGSAGFVPGALAGYRAEVGVSGRRAVGHAARAVPRRLLDRDGARPSARAASCSSTGTTSSGRCTKPLRALPVRRRRPRRLDAGADRARRRRRHTPASADALAALRPVELTLALVALAVVLAFAMVRPRGWPEAVAAVPAAALLIAFGCCPAAGCGARGRATAARRRVPRGGARAGAAVRRRGPVPGGGCGHGEVG